MKRTKKKFSFRGKVAADAAKQHLWKPIKKKVITFSNNPNMKGFRCLRKEFVELPISATAKGMYPVLAYKSDFIEDKPFQLSQENIGVLAGISDWRTIVKAVKELEKEDIIKTEKIERERTYFIYSVNFVHKPEIEEWKGNWYSFYTCIIESGIWAKLTSRAQVFYQAMRSMAEIDTDVYENWLEGADIIGTDETFNEWFVKRPFDIYLGKISVLCRQAGISNRNIGEVVNQLRRYRLIENMSGYYRIYLRPRLDEDYEDCIE